MVVQPDKNRRRAVIRAVDGLLALRIPLLGLVLNRVGSDSDHGYYGYGDRVWLWVRLQLRRRIWSRRGEGAAREIRWETAA